MSIISSKAYRHYLLEDEDFLKYFDKVTPKNIIGKLYIGSRPSKRNASKDIKSLRAIPWVFAWTQIRMLLPAWLGTYLSNPLSLVPGPVTCVDPHHLDSLKCDGLFRTSDRAPRALITIKILSREDSSHAVSRRPLCHL